jgi:hypothetical protein
VQHSTAQHSSALNKGRATARAAAKKWRNQEQDQIKERRDRTTELEVFLICDISLETDDEKSVACSFLSNSSNSNCSDRTSP